MNDETIKTPETTDPAKPENEKAEGKKLYRVISTAPRFPHRGCVYKDVWINWFVNRNEVDESPVPYKDAIVDYDPTTDKGYTEEYVKELFTEVEAKVFSAYLLAVHGPDVTTTLKEITLPMDCKKKGPVGAMAVGGSNDFHMLSEESGYNLKFKVWGYYDVRGCERIEEIKPSEVAPTVTESQNKEPAYSRDAQRLVMSYNNCAANGRCAICGERTDPLIPLAIYLHGTLSDVCDECARKHAPELYCLLRYFYSHAPHDHQTQEYEAWIDAALAANPTDDGLPEFYFVSPNDRDLLQRRLLQRLIRRVIVPNNSTVNEVQQALAYIERQNDKDLLKLEVGMKRIDFHPEPAIPF